MAVEPSRPERPYYADHAASAGTLPPRATRRSDAPVMSLNGAWRFRWAPTVAQAVDGFWEESFDDSSWDAPAGAVALAVARLRRARPTPTSRYPFPVDPPHVPQENPTGDYRRSFDLPGDWPAAPRVLRFDGVDSCFAVWLNGVGAGLVDRAAGCRRSST